MDGISPFAEAQRRIAEWRPGAALDLAIDGLETLPPGIADLVGL